MGHFRTDGMSAELGAGERDYFYEAHNAGEFRSEILRRALEDISNSAHTVMNMTGADSDGDTQTFIVDLERPIARLLEGPSRTRIAQTTKLTVTISGVMYGRPAVTSFAPDFTNQGQSITPSQSSQSSLRGMMSHSDH